MKNLKPLFDFDDILIIPKKKSYIASRYKDIILPRSLPLFTAPMDTVVDIENTFNFMENGIGVTLPRTVKENEYHLIPTGVFVSMGFEDIDYHLKTSLRNIRQDMHILIDVANGHMQKLFDYCREIKRLRPDIILMIGNIANPETYRWYAEGNCVDYIRVGIGNGCFTKGTKINTKNGFKNIENIVVGDEVLTHSGDYKEVIDTKKRFHSEELIKINNIVCTPNHEFYVLNKKHLNIVNDDNIETLCEWVTALELLNNTQYLLLENNVENNEN